MRSVACEPATTVRRTSVATVAHSACQAPAARSSTESAAATCSVAASCGAASAARRTRMERAGLRLCGIVDEPPPSPSASSPISGRDRVSTSFAIRPHASVQPTAASPIRVTGARDVCQGSEGARPSVSASRSRAAAGSSPSSTTAARVPAAPPSCTGNDERHQVVIGVEDRRQPARDLEPERRRHGVLGQGPRDHRRGPMRLGEVGQQADLRPQLATYRGDRVPQQHHQRGVDDVLAGEAAVHPAGGVPVQPFAQDRDEPGHGVAGALGGDRRRIEVGQRPVPDAEHVQPGLLDRDHRPEERRIREVVATPCVPGPEQVCHAVSLAERRGRRSRRRPAAGCRRRSRARRPWRPGSTDGLRRPRGGTGRRPRRAGRRG